MKPTAELTDEELKAELTTYGFSAGPITGTTRSIMQKKLESFRSGSNSISKQKVKKAITKTPATPERAQRPVPPPSSKRVDLNAIDNVVPNHFEPNLTFGAFNDSTTSSTSFNAATSINTAAVKNRTPTPPRGSAAAKPTSSLRQKAAIGSGGLNGGTSASASGGSLFGQTSGSTRYSRNSFGLSGSGYAGTSGALLSEQPSYKRFSTGSTDYDRFEPQEDEEDDHMESSRIISPRNRYRPSLPNSNVANKSFGQQPYGLKKDSSPVEKLKTFGKSAWGFFSRPLGTSTPCSDSGQRYAGYASVSKYRRQTPYPYDSARRSFAASESAKGQGNIFWDISRWIKYGFWGFMVVLCVGYVLKAHPEAVCDGYTTAKDVLQGMFQFLYNYAVMPVSVILFAALIAFGLYKAITYFKRKKSEEKQELMLLVERITDIIYESGPTGVAEPHVRDMIMPPTKRSDAEYKRWGLASHFINNEDSRIRTEIRLIDGTECNVWIWTGAGKQRWQGTAVVEGMARIPEYALTRCLKLRGINFSSNVAEKEALRRELLSKLRPVVPKHIGFLSAGTENVVYMMLRNLNDAKQAFTTFHSHWFNGALITAKYVRDQRYFERFPEAEE